MTPASDAPVTRLVCTGCGWSPLDADPAPFRCGNARAGDDVDHVVRRVLDAGALRAQADPRALFADPEPNPFVRYRLFWHATHVARRGSMSDADFVQLVRDVDGAVARVDGHGFQVTPFAPDAALDGLWIKNETGNVSGSHKGRHLMGILLWIEIARRLGRARGPEAPLAIASCGNAALAAAVVARAAGRALSVFVPPSADPRVLDALARHGARIETCPRVAGEAGDPCVLRFREAVARGAVPFTVQGTANGLAVEGGETLGYEMVSTLLAEGRALDHVVVQVGGGALASAVWRALSEAQELGVIERVPRLHTVQTTGAWPLFRAWSRVASRIAAAGGGPRVPTEPDTARAFEVASWIRGASEGVAEALTWARTHRSRVMSPWEEEPRSVASGILDDETYDWSDVVEGMLRTGGVPVVASEDELRAARERAQDAGYRVDATGSAGLAGVPSLARAGAWGGDVAVLLTGAER